jgi:RHS repeat-associated protein
MLAHLHDTPAHALPRVRSRAQERLRAPGRSWPSATGCKTASKKISFFSRFNPRVRCAPAQTAPREVALFLGASASGACNLRFPGQYADSETGLFYNYYRSYQATQGRYTQNDPIGLDGGLNRYQYVGGNPLTYSDPEGLQPYTGQTPPSSIPGGPFQGPKNPNGGPRDICRYVPDGKNGGPSGAKDGYWKTQEPGQKGWNRFDLRGNPITPEQAHPSNPSNRPVPPVFPGSFPLYPLFCPLCGIALPPGNGPS